MFSESLPLSHMSLWLTFSGIISRRSCAQHFCSSVISRSATAPVYKLTKVFPHSLLNREAGVLFSAYGPLKGRVFWWELREAATRFSSKHSVFDKRTLPSIVLFSNSVVARSRLLPLKATSYRNCHDWLCRCISWLNPSPLLLFLYCLSLTRLSLSNELQIQY